MNTSRTIIVKKLQDTIIKVSFLCCLLLNYSCTKEKATEHDYSKVVTGQVSNIHAGGATFNGSFLSAGTEEIIDHGFVFGTNSYLTIQYNEKISLGASNGKGSFTAAANSALATGVTYYVSAYVQSKEKIFYAEPVSFVSMGGFPPEILHVVPGEGIAGDIVTIGGKYFGNSPLSNNVTFNNKPALIISASDTEIVVRAPESGGNEVFDIFVTTAGQTAQEINGFRYLKPEVTGITPLSGRVGDRITIQVDLFNNTLLSTVSLGEYPLRVISSTKNEIIVEIRDDIPALVAPITIVVDDHSILTEEFEVISPWIKLKTLPMPGRKYSTAYTDNDSGFVCFGSANANTWPYYSITFRDWWEYNHFTDSWQEMFFSDGFFGGERSGALSFQINHQIFVGYGSGRGDCTDFYQIDQGNWILKNDQYSPFLGAHMSSFVVNDAAYICGGSYNNDLWQYTPKYNNWAKKSIVSSLQTRCYGISFSYNDKGYFGLGSISNRTFNDIWEYVVMNDTWNLKTNVYPDGATSGAIVFVIDNRVFVGLGTQSSNRYSRTIWEYFSENDLWKNVTTIPTGGREGAFVFVLDNKAYIGSGYNGNFLNDFYEFDPSKL